MQDAVNIINEIWTVLSQMSINWMAWLLTPPTVFIPIIGYILINNRRFRFWPSLALTIFLLGPIIFAFFITIYFTIGIPVATILKRPQEPDVILYAPSKRRFGRWNHWF